MSFRLQRRNLILVKIKDGIAVLLVISTVAEKSHPFDFSTRRDLSAPLHFGRNDFNKLSFFPNSRTTVESGVIFVRAKASCYLYFLSFRIVPTKCSVSVHFRLVGMGGVQPYAKQLSFTESNCAFLGCDDDLGAPLYAVAFLLAIFSKSVAL